MAKRRRSFRKKFMRRRRSALTRYTSRPSSYGPLPDLMTTKLKYSVTWNQQIAAAVSATTINKASVSFMSSLYDPEATAGGHQSLFYDQLGNFYQKYKVLGIKYRLETINIDGTKPYCVLVKPCWDTTADTSFNTLCERPFVRKRWGTGVYSSKPLVVSGYASVAKVYGVTKKDVMSDAYYEGDWGANPTRMIYLDVYLHSTDTSVIANTQMKMDITYYCQLYSKQQTQAGS